MYLRLIGAVLIVVSCGAVGFRMAHEHRKRLKLLYQFRGVLEDMTCELQYRLTPLPELCDYVSKGDRGVIGMVFRDLSAMLENQVSPDAETCMRSVADQYRNLPEPLCELLCDLGKTLGKFDLQGQLTGISSVIEKCDAAIRRLSENQESRLRNYQTLGLCAGAALVILFI